MKIELEVVGSEASPVKEPVDKNWGEVIID